MKIFLLVSALFFAAPFSFSQNLVLNPGFEAHGELSGNNPSYDNLRGNHVEKWLSANGGSPDYYLRSTNYLFNQYGAPKSRTGNAMAGIAVYDGKRNYREYIEGELSEELKADSVYTFTIALALASNSGFNVQQMGVYLSAKMFVDRKLLNPLKLVPQLIIDSTDKAGIFGQWLVFRAEYTAAGGEKFLIIGNFNSDKRTVAGEISKDNGKAFPYSYYYIDDVSLSPKKEEVLSEEIPEEIVETEKPADTLGIAPGKKLVAQNVYFETDKSVLKESSFPILDQVIAAMKDQPNLQVEIDGHTDKEGNDAHNQTLSADRARSVAAYFIAHGIESERISTRGYGSSKPISEENEKNRRVEFLFSE